MPRLNSRLIWRTLSAAATVALLSLTSGALAPRARETARGIACKGFPCGRLFVIAVGVDGEGEFKLRFAASDAERIVQHLLLRPDSTGKDTASQATREARFRRATRALSDSADDSTRAQVALLTGAQATLANVARAFQQVTQKAKSRDGFVFYFGGRSLSLPATDSATPSRHFLGLSGTPAQSVDGLTGIRDPRERGAWEEKGLPIPQLEQWLHNILSEDQLFLVEASKTDELLADFVASTLESEQRAGALSERNRVVVGPRFVGRETSQGGALAYAVATSPHPVGDLLFPPRRGRTESRLVAAADSVGGSNYLRIVYLREYLDLFRMVAARAKGASRGVAAVPGTKPAPSLSGTGGRNYALVIGTDLYQGSPEWSPLANPVADARAIADELRLSFGFETTLLTNPVQDSIRSALAAFHERGTDSAHDQVLVFIAGHGYYDEQFKMGHIVAHDSKPRAADRFLKTYLSHNELANYVQTIPSKHTLVVLDVCFGGTFSDQLRGASSRSGETYPDADLGRFVREKMQYTSRFYLTSGGKVYVPDGRPGRNSPFASRFLAALRESSQEGRVLTMARLRARIEGLLPDPHSGVFGDSEPGGDFLFIPKGLVR